LLPKEGGQATSVEEYVSLGGAPAFCNTRDRTHRSDNTVALHYMIEREDTQASMCQPAHRSGRQRIFLLTRAHRRHWFATTFIRSSAGEGGECLINGLFIGKAASTR